MQSFKDSPAPPVSAWESPYLQIVIKLIIWSPWIWFFLFGSFVLVTTLQTGHLPTYGQPDPKDAGLISLFYLPTIFLLIGVISTTPFGLGMTIIKLWRGTPQSVKWKEVIFYLGGAILFFLFVLSDIAGLMTWIAD